MSGPGPVSGEGWPEAARVSGAFLAVAGRSAASAGAGGERSRIKAERLNPGLRHRICV